MPVGWPVSGPDKGRGGRADKTGLHRLPNFQDMSVLGCLGFVSRDMAGAGSLTTSLNRPAAWCRRVRAHQTSGTVRRATTTASGTDTTNGTLIDADAKRRKLPTDTAACAAGGSLYDTARWRADRTDRLVRVPSGDQGRARARQGQIGTLRRVRSWSIASVCGRICLLGELPVGKLRLLEGLKVRRAGLAGDARGRQALSGVGSGLPGWS